MDAAIAYLAPRYAIANADQPPLPRLYSATGMALRHRYSGAILNTRHYDVSKDGRVPAAFRSQADTGQDTGRRQS